jgi:acyl-CoA thioester hydrolase
MARPVRYPFVFKQRVNWGDMDALRHVNNVSYARYFENVRAEYFSDLHQRYNYQVPDNISLVMNRLEINYRGQVFFPDELDLTLGVAELTSRNLTLACSMWNREGRCVCDGLSAHVWIDVNSGRAVRMPEVFRTVADALGLWPAAEESAE